MARKPARAAYAPLHNGNGNGTTKTIDQRSNVNIVFVALILAYCGTMSWWASGIDYTVKDVRAKLEAQVANGDRLTRMEEAVKALSSRVDDKTNGLKEQLENGLGDVKRLIIAQFPTPIQDGAQGRTPAPRTH